MSDHRTPPEGQSGDPGNGGVGTATANSGSDYVPPHLRPPLTGKERRPGRRRKRKSFVRRHKILISLGVLLVVVLGAAGGYLYWVNNQLTNIERVDAGIEPDTEHEGGEKTKALNILLLGADAGGEGDQSVAEDMKDGEWTPFAHRSDTLMIAHIPADRDSVQLVSIPRDTWVPIDGYPYSGGSAKINAAFAYGGPKTAVDTVEELTGVKIDHVAIIDWEGFKDLSKALGGVRVYIPETFYDSGQDITWEQGWHELEGGEALAYVRTRHGLENGDFDRIARQQNFMRATMGEVLASAKNPIAVTKVVGVITEFLTIDDTWSNQELIDLALSLRGISSKDVAFMTAPFGGYDTSPDGQSIIELDPKKSKRLFRALEDDRIDKYLERYPEEVLDDDREVG
jgi:LCP family protein required for cell wall assembly